MPTVLSSVASARANRSDSRTSPLRPSVAIGGHWVNGAFTRAPRPPSWSTDTQSGRSGTSRDASNVTPAPGATPALFPMVGGALLRPLPSPAPERLVAVYELKRGLKQAPQLVAPVRLEEWNRTSRSFAGLAGTYFENMTDTTGALPERVAAMRTSPRFFTVMGVAPNLGRAPSAAEETFGGPAVVIISDSFLRAPFNRDP